MLAGCTGYIYWYMRAHWAFVGTGEPVEIDGKKITIAGNSKNKLLPRAYVMSHFSKHVTGSTRLGTKSTISVSTEAPLETSAYIKGDSLIVMAIDTTTTAYDLKLKLPYKVKEGIHLLSTGNESANLCQSSTITIGEPVQEVTVSLPARSLNTYIFMIEHEETGINEVKKDGVKSENYGIPNYDLSGRIINSQNKKGLFIENGKKIFKKR